MKKTYILSTKFVEKSFPYTLPDRQVTDITQLATGSQEISLLSFYNDLWKPVKFYNNQLKYPDGLAIDRAKLRQVGLEQDFSHIYSILLNEQEDKAYITFSYPFHIASTIAFNWYYWLAAYFEDICKLEGITSGTLGDQDFIFVLHDRDLGLTDMTIHVDLPKMISTLHDDTRGLFEDTLFEQLITRHADRIALSFCYAHNKNPVHQLIKNYDPENGPHLFDRLATAVAGYGDAKEL